MCGKITFWVSRRFLTLLDSEAGEGDSDGQAVLPYRYEVKPLESFKTNCYKSNPLGANTDSESHKPWTIGATMLGNFDKLPRQENNKTASLVWEARGISVVEQGAKKAIHLKFRM